MITQEDTIFVAGMDANTTENDIAGHFGAIGLIKVSFCKILCIHHFLNLIFTIQKDKRTMAPKIWMYKHKDSGIFKGEATVTYIDPNAAQSAIEWFDGGNFNGKCFKIVLMQCMLIYKFD